MNILTASSIRANFASAYSGVTVGAFYARNALEQGLSVKQAVLGLVVDTLFEPIDSGVEFVAAALGLFQVAFSSAYSFISTSGSGSQSASFWGSEQFLIGSWLLQRYGSLRYHNRVYLPGAGMDANHLNQKAAFPAIPDNQGLALKLKGPINDPNSEHGRFHTAMEQDFWDHYRRGGRLRGQNPTVNDYNRAAVKALDRVGLSRDEVARIVTMMRVDQKYFKVPADIVKVPRRVGSVPRRP